MNKQELRKAFSAVRKSIEQREAKNESIAERAQYIIDAHSSVFCYVSFGSEVNTKKIIQKNSGKIYIPHTHDGIMHCRKYLGGELNADKLGNIDIACYGKEETAALTIVPMLAFDKCCYRLGYGGGYYDKYLASAFTVKVGLAYDEQYSSESLNEIFDVPLDFIITPTKIYKR